MSYLAYLYDTRGHLEWIATLDTPVNPLPVAHIDDPTLRRFVLTERGQTVRGLPRLIYREVDALCTS